MIVLIALVCGALLAYILWKKKQNLPPGPLGLPIIGNLLYLNATEPYVSLTELSKIYGPIYGLYLGSVYTVVLANEQLIREALKMDHFTGRAPLYITHGIMGGYGLICSEGELWRDQRKLSIGWLKKLGMVKYGPGRTELQATIMTGVNDCINTLSETTNKCDPYSILHHTIGNVMNSIVFGLTYDKNDTTWKYLQHLQEEGVKYIGVSGVVNFLPWLRFLPSNRKIIDFLLTGKQKTHRIYDEIIENIQSKLEANQWKSNVGSTSVSSSSIAEMFLCERRDRLLNGEAKAKLCSHEQLRHLLADLFGAGVDTTLTTLRWFLLFISMNSVVQGKIKKEMRDQLGESIPPTLDDYDKLPYLKACIAETQRIRSVVPIGIPHGCNHSTVLNGFNIPKGTMLIPLQWAVHMDATAWTDPEKFDPDRFISAAGSFTSPPQFIPFQTGKRMCLGDELAKMILFGYCSRIMFSFDIGGDLSSSDEAPNGDCGITLTPPVHLLTFVKTQNSAL